MADRYISERNLKFLLYEVFDAEILLKYPRYADHSREVFDVIFDAAVKVGADFYRPLFAEMDRNEPQYQDGEVKVHPAVRKLMREMGAGGWIAPATSYAFGGRQLPSVIGIMIANSIFSAANYSASIYAGLTGGAASLVMSYACAELQRLYLPKMMTGEWQGTVATTEAQAGSSLSDIATQAFPTDEGYYKIKGRKVFIAAGDHDGADNVVHLMLARIDGAPAGVKGLSLFLVPKKRVETDGTLTFNDVRCAGIHPKMGYHGCPTVKLNFGDNGDCRGWLISPPNEGLAYMFFLMNGSRIYTGISAAAIASAAYHASLDYAKNRLQGRRHSSKDALSDQIPLIEHPDVRRMLLFQRAVVEGAQSLLMHCCLLTDLALASKGEEKENAQLLLYLLTPVAKSWPAEMGVQSCNKAIQVMGGQGYCKDFPVEQYFRDVRIHPIHEGVTAIQAQDLLGRKMSMEKGKAAKLFYRVVGKSIRQASLDSDLKVYALELEKALGRLEQVTGYLFGLAAQGNMELFLADASLYLEFFGIVAVGWQWLLQAMAAKKALIFGDGSPDDGNFYDGKLATCRYYFIYELPKVESLAASLTRGSSLTVDMKTDWFDS